MAKNLESNHSFKLYLLEELINIINIKLITLINLN